MWIKLVLVNWINIILFYNNVYSSLNVGQKAFMVHLHYVL